MSDEVLNALYEQHLPFRLYADHQYGLTVEELACLANQPVYWIEEQIEAMRLCLEKQVRLDLTSGLTSSPGAIWRGQIWDYRLLSVLTGTPSFWPLPPLGSFPLFR